MEKPIDFWLCNNRTLAVKKMFLKGMQSRFFVSVTCFCKQPSEYLQSSRFSGMDY